MRLIGEEVEAPQCLGHAPHLAEGTPSARHQRISSGEIGAAPVTQEARAVHADHLAHVVQRDPARQRELQLEPRAHWLAGEHAVGDARADADRPGIAACCSLLESFSATVTRVELLPHARHGGEMVGRSRARSPARCRGSRRSSASSRRQTAKNRRRCARRCGTAAGSRCARRLVLRQADGCAREIWSSQTRRVRCIAPLGLPVVPEV